MKIMYCLFKILKPLNKETQNTTKKYQRLWWE